MLPHVENGLKDCASWIIGVKPILSLSLYRTQTGIDWELQNVYVGKGMYNSDLMILAILLFFPYTHIPYQRYKAASHR